MGGSKSERLGTNGSTGGNAPNLHVRNACSLVSSMLYAL